MGAPVAAAGTTYTVDAGGNGDFQTIQAALDASIDGDVVEVQPGVYREQVVVDTNVTLRAPNGATLNGSTFGSETVGLEIRPWLSTGLVVDGFTIEHYGDGIGVGTSAAEDSPGYHYHDYGESAVTGGWTIRDVTVRENAEDGIDVGPATVAWTMTRVTAVHNGDDGIEVGGYQGTAAWTIQESNASVNKEVGIRVSLSEGDWRILDSTTNDNFDGMGTGVYITSRNGAWTIDNHTAVDNSFYGIDIAGSFSGDWTVSNATITDNGGSGIGNGGGIEGTWTIRDSLVANNYDWGIYVPNAPDDFHIRNVTVEQNNRGGIATDYTTGNWLIEDSTIRENGDYRGGEGLSAGYTEGAWTVYNSTITANTNAGIVAEEGADGRPVGDATDNWWGQAGGPLADQCLGNVDCSAPLDSEPGTSAPPTVGVQGQLTNASGAPVSGVDVTVYRDDGTDFVEVATGTTKSDGTYSIDGIEAAGGSAALKIRFAAGTSAYTTEWYDNASTKTGATMLTVNGGAVQAGVDAVLTERRTVQVTGVVTNASGAPLDGLFVIPYVDDGTGSFVQGPGVGTDLAGRYTTRIELAPGQASVDVKVAFVDPDDVYATRYYDDAAALADATPVSVAAGGTATVNETLPLVDEVTAGFSGTVTNEAGDRLEGIEVTVFREDATGTFREWTTEQTDADGGFDIDVRPVDQNNALVRVKLRFRDATGQYTTIWYDQASQSTSDAAAGLVSAHLSGLNATLVDEAAPPADVARVSGWVSNETGDPLDGLLVVVYRDDGSGSFTTLPAVGTDENGRYSTEVAVPSGRTSAAVKVSFVDPDGIYATRYYDGAATRAAGTAITIPGGETRFVSETLPFEADVTAGLTGVLTNESGAPLEGIEVTVFRDDGTGTFREWTTELTDANGQYDVAVRPVNESDSRVRAKLRISDPTWTYAQEWVSDSYRNARTMADAEELSPVVGGSTTRDEVLERNVVTVSGRVRNAAGDPLDGILVVPHRLAASGSYEQDSAWTTYTDEFGEYETVVPVRDGETTIDLKVGFADPDDEYATRYWRNNSSMADASPITADAGWELPNVRIDLPRRAAVSGIYLGTVNDENGTPLEDALVTVYRDDGTGTFQEWTNVRTDDAGYWETAVSPPDGASNVSVKIRYRDANGDYLEEWEFNESSRASADVKTLDVGETAFLYGTALAPAPHSQVSGVVRADTPDNSAIEGVLVTAFRDDGTGTFHPYETVTTDDAGYYEFHLTPPVGALPGSSVSTRLYFTDPSGTYASMWYRDARRSTTATELTAAPGEGDYFNDQWLPPAGLLLDVSVQALDTCPDPTDAATCTFSDDEDTVSVGPGDAVAVRYELWNSDDEAYTDYDVTDPTTGTTMFGANQQVSILDTRTSTATLTAPNVDGTYDYRANATSVADSGAVSDSQAWYTVEVRGSVVQQVTANGRFDASVSGAGAGDPVLVGGSQTPVSSLENTTFESLLMTTDGGNFTLNITGNESLPAGLTPPVTGSTGSVLGSLTVDHSTSDAATHSVEFRFGVEKRQLAGTQFTSADVVLYRYVDGSPTPLDTSLVRQTPSTYVFEATSPGLSVFVIGASETTEPSNADADQGSEGSSGARHSSQQPAATATATSTPEEQTATTETSTEAPATDEPTATPTASSTTTPESTEAATVAPSPTSDAPSTRTRVPGFSLLLAVVSLLGAGILLGHRSRRREDS